MYNPQKVGERSGLFWPFVSFTFPDMSLSQLSPTWYKFSTGWGHYFWQHIFVIKCQRQVFAELQVFGVPTKQSISTWNTRIKSKDCEFWSPYYFPLSKCALVLQGNKLWWIQIILYYVAVLLSLRYFQRSWSYIWEFVYLSYLLISHWEGS